MEVVIATSEATLKAGGDERASAIGPSGIISAGACSYMKGGARVHGACSCPRSLCSLYVTTKGDVRPCPMVDADRHPSFRRDGRYPLNVRRQSLKEIYYSGLMYYSRHIDSFLPDGRCEGEQGIGCRGYAYTVGIAEGRGPLESLALACRLCERAKRHEE